MGNLFPANQMDGYHTTFNLITMSVDAEYEVVVDAALAFGGLDQHDTLNSRCAASGFRYECKLHQAACGFRSTGTQEFCPHAEPRRRKRWMAKSGVTSGLGSPAKHKAAGLAAVCN